MEIISADLQPSDLPPFYSLASGDQPQNNAVIVDEEGWTIRWRTAVRGRDTGAISLPTLSNKQYFASLKSLLKLPVRQLVPLHRYNNIIIL